MIDVVDTRIKAFGKTPKAGFVSSSEQLITLTIGQLQELVIQAVEKAIQPLQDQLSDTRAIVDNQAEKITTLEATVNTLGDNQFIQLRLIGQLREATKKEAQPLQRDRGDILRALIAANGGKMLAKDARQKMRLSRSVFSQLTATMKDDIEVKPFNLRKNQKVIILKSCLAKQ
jgi:molybdopterin converting factor small subunit